MANRNYVMLEDKDGKEVLPVTDGNGVFVEGGTKTRKQINRNRNF